MSRYLEPYTIDGKRALITGASSGIGEACALMFAERGVNLVLVARRIRELERVRNMILENHAGITVEIMSVDLTNVAEIATLKDTVGAIDILINSAGLALGTPRADEIDLAEARQLLDTNAFAAIAMFRAFVPDMRERNSGHVVNIGSVAAFECYEGGSIYNASKHALLGFTNSARMDLANTNVRVTIINPGIVDTNFWSVRFKGDDVKAESALKGLEVMTPFDIADQVVYALTRPLRCQIADVHSYCNHQAHARYVIHREV